MCVAVAFKTKLKNSDAENWFLMKLRDRSYSPKYQVRFSTKKEVESVFLIDQVSDWTEGVNSAGIMLVSTALQNHEDKKDDGSKRDKKVTRNGIILRQVLGKSKIEEIVKILEDECFTGNTFVSDGKRLFVLEISVNNSKAANIENDLLQDPKVSEMTDEEIEELVKKNLTKDDFDIVVKELTDSKETLHVRTNHGIFSKKAGYQPKDGEGYESSTKRYTHVMDTLGKLESNDHPFEYLTALKNLSKNEVDKKEENRPVRVKGNDTGYWTSTAVMLTPTGTLFTIPLDSTFESSDFNRIYKTGRKVHFVLLPKDLPLFESSKGSKHDSLIFGMNFGKHL